MLVISITMMDVMQRKRPSQALGKMGKRNILPHDDTELRLFVFIMYLNRLFLIMGILFQLFHTTKKKHLFHTIQKTLLIVQLAFKFRLFILLSDALTITCLI